MGGIITENLERYWWPVPKNWIPQITLKYSYKICCDHICKEARKELVKIKPFSALPCTFCQQHASGKSHQHGNCGSTRNNYLENTLNGFVSLKMFFKKAVFSSWIENFSDCLWKLYNPNSNIGINHCKSGYNLLILF